MKIDKTEAWLLSIPLKYTYHLSFADVPVYKTILVRITAGDKIGIGESTPLPGYDSKTPDDVWSFVSNEIKKMPGMSVRDALQTYRGFNPSEGFAYCALNCALEMLDDSRWKRPSNTEIQLVGTLNAHDISGIEKEIENLCLNGYKTLKVKVGRNVSDDIKRVQEIDRLLPVGTKMRIDANQGYSLEDARQFLKYIPDGKVELFEQPLPVPFFEDTATLKSETDVPIMLDESIKSIDDISLAARLGACDFIKLKLMKCGSITKTIEYAQFAEKNGFGVVLGNGVQSDIGSYLEALIQKELKLTAAGEMNGFNKQADSMLVESLKQEKAGIVIRDGFRPVISLAVLNKFVKETLSYSRSLSVRG